MSGAGWWHDVPARRPAAARCPGFVAGWIYIVIVSFRELGSSVLLYSPGKEVLSIVIWEQWRDGHPAERRGARRDDDRRARRPRRASRTSSARRDRRQGGVMGLLEVSNLVKTFTARARRAAQPRARRRRRLVRRSTRASSSRCSARRGCGKTTTLRSIAGLETPDEGEITRRRPRALLVGSADARPGERARPRDGVPVVRDLAAHERLRQRRLPAAGAAAQASGRRGSRSASGSSGCSRSSSSTTSPTREATDALGRPAAAPRARARARDGAAAAAARRAAVEPRREAARGHALRAEAPAARARHHRRLRDARPGRGARDVERDRGHARRHGSSRSASRARSTRRPTTRFVADFIGTSNFIDGVVEARSARRLSRAHRPTANCAFRSELRARGRGDGRRLRAPGAHRADDADRNGGGPNRWQRHGVGARAFLGESSTTSSTVGPREVRVALQLDDLDPAGDRRHARVQPGGTHPHSGR